MSTPCENDEAITKRPPIIQPLSVQEIMRDALPLFEVPALSEEELRSGCTIVTTVVEKGPKGWIEEESVDVISRDNVLVRNYLKRIRYYTLDKTALVKTEARMVMLNPPDHPFVKRTLTVVTRHDKGGARTAHDVYHDRRHLFQAKDDGDRRN